MGQYLIAGTRADDIPQVIDYVREQGALTEGAAQSQLCARTHAGHLRDYRDAVRAGQSPTAAQTQHVIADIIDWLRLSEDRL